MDSEKMHRKGSFHRGLAGWVEFARGRVKVEKSKYPLGTKAGGMTLKAYIRV